MSKLKRLKILIIYGLQLLKATRREFLASRNFLHKYFTKYISAKDLVKYKTLLNSIYFNTGLMGPIFYEYARLVGNKDKSVKEKIYTLSALLLIEDILLDELKIDSSRLESFFSLPDSFIPQNSLESIFKYTYLQFVQERYDNKFIQMIEKLNKAQVSAKHDKDSVSGKGLWLPILVYLYNPRMSFSEIEILQDLGTWIKYVDDLVDLAEDKKNGNTNPLFTFSSRQQASKFVDEYLFKLIKQIVRLPYPKVKIRRFIYGIKVQTIAFKKYNQYLNNIFIFYKPLKHRFLFMDMFFLTLASALGLGELLKIDATH